MQSKYQLFDRTKLKLLPLDQRQHDLHLDSTLELVKTDDIAENLQHFSKSLIKAKTHQSSCVMMIGAHVLRAGVQRYLIDLMKQGYISCLAVNGACVIHDFELSLIGSTTESVARYIKTGQFGLWQETGIINDIVTDSQDKKLGFGESVGRYIVENNLPHSGLSVIGQAYQLNIPVTVHVGIGYDIIHQHPNFDAEATGGASYRDFLIFTEHLNNIENGVVMNFGSAVMAPEVFLKSLAMVRNAKRNSTEQVTNFSTLVCDLKSLPPNYHQESSKKSPLYFFRPWKTMLVRTNDNKGQSYYVQGDHRQTIPALWTSLKNEESDYGLA